MGVSSVTSLFSRALEGAGAFLGDRNVGVVGLLDGSGVILFRDLTISSIDVMLGFVSLLFVDIAGGCMASSPGILVEKGFLRGYVGSNRAGRFKGSPVGGSLMSSIAAA